ncbi:MAG TPA: CHAT domain-containing protein, partial [Trueperaceae bacterium]|nr:CHAT domain-containing protein [Trueperaceae bacterium]
MLKLDPGRSGTRRSGSDSQRQAGIDLGGALFDAVFREDVMLAWSRSQDATRTAGQGLRLRLRLTDAPQIAGLPWELLYDRRSNSYVAQSERTPLLRYLEVPYPPRPLAVGGPLHVLVVLAAPTDLPELDIEAEWSRLRKAMSAHVGNGTVVLERLTVPTMPELIAWLRREPVHVLHFVGHGDYDERTQSGVVYFCDQYGRSVAVGPEMLGPFLHDHDPLRLVFLNACRSARVDAMDPFSGMAQGLVQQDVTAVVAMQFPISDGAAVAFTSAFYAAVAEGIPVDQATTWARKELLLSHPGEWATPVLFSRAPDGRVFDEIIAAEPAAAEPELESVSPETVAAGEAQLPVSPAPSTAGNRRRPWTRRHALTVIVAAVVLAAGGIVAALLVRSSSAPSSPSRLGEASYSASAPWRLRIDGTSY